MKFLVLAVCMCMAAAQPQRFSPSGAAQTVASAAVTAAKVAASPFAAGAEAAAEVLRSNSDVKLDGYSYDGETSNGIVYQASGTLKKIGDQEAVVSQGSYKYNNADGSVVEVVYTADENGYQPQSAYLPTPPPVPEAIARSLEYIAAHPPAVEKKY